MKRILIVLGVAFVVAGCGATTSVKPDSANAVVAVVPEPLSVDTSTYLVEMPLGDSVAFYGQPQPKSTAKESRGGPLYPGDSAATFFASVMAHALISKGVQDAEKKARIEAANAILEPYLPLIDEISPEYLQAYATDQAGLTQNLPFSIYDESSDVRGWHTKVNPVFFMSHTEDAIAIRAQVTIYATDAEEDAGPVYERTVHLHSLPVSTKEMWFDEGGETLLGTVYDLTRDALVFAIHDYQGRYDATDIKQTTIRYLENGIKTVERGKIIDRECGFVIFESLRNELKRVQSLDGC